MGRRCLIFVAYLLLALHGAAFVHQVLPHSAEHGDGDSCALCVLIAGTVLLAVALAIPLRQETACCRVISTAPFSSRPRGRVYFVRGPPKP